MVLPPIIRTPMPSPTHEELITPPDKHADHVHGKTKQRDVRFEYTLSTPSPGTSFELVDEMAYPPINDDAEETRRVEENLRGWEIAERQRRKAARTSASTSSPTSLVGDVSRRTSHIWSGRKSRHSSLGGLGGHSARLSQDNIDIVPLTQMDSSPTPSPTRSDSDEAHLADPFTHPSESLSPFADSHESKTRDSQVPSSSRLPGSTPSESHLMPVPAPLARPPPPKPLNLPPPRTPPPNIITLSPTFPSKPNFQNTQKEENIRWWHDWLCGCNEGPDRGGEFQAGRTNPFE